MNTITDSHPKVSRLEIVDRGRRRNFTDEAKLRIVAESYAREKQVTATADRYGILRTLLNDWRRAVRQGRLGAMPAEGFIPALVVPDVPTPAGRSVSDGGRMEVASANGRRVIVDRSVDVEALVRIMRGLETLR
ncbi:transposase [Ensifer adhaerens]|nr:transposase [Ensifer adhaerens]